MRVREGHIVDQFQQLVNPLRPIPRQITTLTGITDAMVADLDPIDEVLPRFIAWLATPAAGQKQRRNPPPAVGGKEVVYSPYSLAMTDQRSAAA